MRLLAFALFLALFQGCSARQTGMETPPGSFTIDGTMEFINLETGCWVVRTADGRRYEPAGEDLNILWREGLTVSLRVRPMPDVRSTCQTGEIVEVIQILKAEE